MSDLAAYLVSFLRHVWATRVLVDSPVEGVESSEAVAAGVSVAQSFGAS